MRTHRSTAPLSAKVVPPAFRPRLTAEQRRDLVMVHHVNLDAIARGEGTVQLLWDWVGNLLAFSRMAHCMRLGEPEMNEQLELASRTIERFRRTGRVGWDGPDYQLAKAGCEVMEQLADRVDQFTAEAAVVWAMARLAGVRAATERGQAT
jgi:hypothetical protein